MEEQLYGSVSKEFIKTGGKGTADDEAYYKTPKIGRASCRERV